MAKARVQKPVASATRLGETLISRLRKRAKNFFIPGPGKYASLLPYSDGCSCRDMTFDTLGGLKFLKNLHLRYQRFYPLQLGFKQAELSHVPEKLCH
jgi:hypothetical protein